MLSALIITYLAFSTLQVESEVKGLISAGRHVEALGALNQALQAPGASALSPAARLQLEKLRARCLFQLGDYGQSEAILRSLLAGARIGSAGHAELTAQLALTLSFQDAHDRAIRMINQAISAFNVPDLHRLAISILLRAGRYPEIRKHADFLLSKDPRDGLAHFAGGIALSREGRFEEALRALAWGRKLPNAGRDARFEMALALSRLRRREEALGHLIEIIVDNPYDQEACYQISRQLIQLRKGDTLKIGARVMRYFEALQKAQGMSSRDHHFQAAGKAATAALLRSARWERLGNYARAISEIQAAEMIAKDDATPCLYAAEFWARMGFLAETAVRLDALGKGRFDIDHELKGKIESARGTLKREREALQAKAAAPLGMARLAIADALWRGAGKKLEALLMASIKARDLEMADKAARLLLARAPDSVAALEFLIFRTASSELVIPRIHFLARLSALQPDNLKRKGELERARRMLLGKAGAD